MVDVGPAVHQGAGLSRYAERLVAHLLAHQSHRLDLTCFFNRHSGHSLPSSLQAARAATLSLGQYTWRLSVLASQLTKTPYIPVERRMATPATLYHASEHLLPHLRRPTVLTVHDLIFLQFPHHHTSLNRLFLTLAMPLFVNAAHAIIAVSHHTRADLLNHYPLPPEKITVIHEGVDSNFQPANAAQQERVRACYSPDRPYLLMVGTLEPRKNHIVALRALASLRSAGYPHRLLIVGGAGWLFEPIEQIVHDLSLADRVHFAGYVPGEDLPPLYSAADCVLVPSLYEGFGFPVLEAMACAAPVICSNVSSLPEVAGSAAIRIPPHDHEALAQAIRLILDQPALARHMREMGRAHAARFDWSATAQATADLYLETAARSRSTF